MGAMTPENNMGEVGHRPDPKSPYARIVLASRKGKGVRLTADEVADMAIDAAIETRGLLDLEEWD